MIFAFLTCTRVRWEDECEEPIEEHGWVDKQWSMRELYDSRNDVGPVIAIMADSEELADEVREALSLLPGGFEDNGDGSFYAVDTESPFDDPEGWTYSYALHFTRKLGAADNWAEKPWSPVHDGHINLKG